MLPSLYGDRDLKPREQKIVGLVTLGLKNADIAREIGTSEHMVKNYIRVIYDKLGMWNRVELALWDLAHREKVATETRTLER